MSMLSWWGEKIPLREIDHSRQQVFHFSFYSTVSLTKRFHKCSNYKSFLIKSIRTEILNFSEQSLQIV